jgi:MFS family permease
LGAFYLASRTGVQGLRRNIPLAVSAFGLGIIGMSLSRFLPVALLLTLIAGFGMMVQVASSNTWLQMNVDDDKRGRMISFFAVSFLGMAPFGSLLAGVMAGAFGVPLILFIGGVCCIFGAFVFQNRKERPPGQVTRPTTSTKQKVLM